MFAELEIFVAPNQFGNLPVFRVFSGEGKDLGLYEAYDAADAVACAACDEGLTADIGNENG